MTAETALAKTVLAHVGALIHDAVTAGRVPGVVAGVGRGPSTLGSWVAGYADTTTDTVPPGGTTPPNPPGHAGRLMRADTVFDLASLTKVVGTTTVTLALAGNGRLGLDDPVSRYLPVTWDVSVRQLLSHTSGLPATVKFYEWCTDRDQLLRDLYATPLEAPPGSRVAYSDLGFMALGEIVGRVAGEPLDVLFLRLVASPLGLPDTGYLPSGPAERFAATELRDDGTPWTGIVHDENARVMGGVAGHAGLFATLSDLARFAAWWVSGDDGLVPVSLRREAEKCQTLALDGRRGLGWTCIGDRYDILGPSWPPSAVSHTGFTGTSLALESVSGLWVVLLTNRVHFGRDGSAVKALRLDVHAAVAKLALQRAVFAGSP